MRPARLLLIACAACVPLVHAQVPAAAPAPAPLGTVTEVHGLVTMSIGSQVGTVQPGTPIFDGARFVSSSSGNMQMSLPGGCIVKLAPNQIVAVDGGLTCAQQIAAIGPVPGATGMFASGSIGPIPLNVLPLAGAAALAGAVARLPEPEITPRPR